MRIPNSLILIHPQHGTSNTQYRPAYYAGCYRQVWARRLDDTKPGGGVEVAALPGDACDDARYSTSDGPDFEYRKMQGMFGAAIMAHCFPDGEADVSREIERLFVADAQRLRENMARDTAPAPTPHPEWLKIGLSNEKAVALQQAGYANLKGLPADTSMVTLCRVPGITALDAATVLDATIKK
jgi:hypothetical protein